MIEPRVEPGIASQVERVLPASYRELGPLLARLMRRWAEWAETDGEFAHRSRELLTYSDVDLVPDELLQRFASKYAPDLRVADEQATRRLVRHALTLFRARGTPAAIDLYLRLAHGAGAEVYYPWRDVFRPSSGRWRRPVYLELSTSQRSELLARQEVRGLTSGATGFVDRVVRKRGPATRSGVVARINGLEGSFIIGERVQPVDESLAVADCPWVLGSARSVTVLVGGTGVEVGDRLFVRGAEHGYGAQVRVKEVEEETGAVQWSLLRAGYGYSNAHVVRVSEQVLAVDVTPGWSDADSYFAYEDALSQPMQDVTVSNASGTFVRGDVVTGWYANGDQSGFGTVLSYANSIVTAASGTGSLDADFLGTPANAVLASIDSWADATASGTVISEDSMINLAVSNGTASFSVGERVSHSGAYGNVTFSVVNSETGNGEVILDPRVGQVSVGSTITGNTSGQTAYVDRVRVRVGLVDVTGTFVADELAPVEANTSGATGLVDRVGAGTGASLSTTGLALTETITWSDELIQPYASMDLANTDYGFPPVGAEDASTVVDDALAPTSYVVGSIAGVTSAASGEDYTDQPMARIEDELLLGHRNVGWTVEYVGATAAFAVGELVTQSATGARGRVEELDSRSLKLRRLSALAKFVLTSNSTTTIIGQTTGATANVTCSLPCSTSRFYDELGRYIGLDAQVRATSTTSTGVIRTLEVVDSGFMFRHGESVELIDSRGVVVGTGVVGLAGVGIGPGRWVTRGGQPSYGKKIRDSYYWQQFSYDVRTGVPLVDYAETLERVLHVAGTIAFGTLRLSLSGGSESGPHMALSQSDYTRPSYGALVSILEDI